MPLAYTNTVHGIDARIMDKVDKVDLLFFKYCAPQTKILGAGMEMRAGRCSSDRTGPSYTLRVRGRLYRFCFPQLKRPLWPPGNLRLGSINCVLPPGAQQIEGSLMHQAVVATDARGKTARVGRGAL
jgi:hypothetical protein